MQLEPYWTKGDVKCRILGLPSAALKVNICEDRRDDDLRQSHWPGRSSSPENTVCTITPASAGVTLHCWLETGGAGRHWQSAGSPASPASTWVCSHPCPVSWNDYLAPSLGSRLCSVSCEVSWVLFKHVMCSCSKWNIISPEIPDHVFFLVPIPIFLIPPPMPLCVIAHIKPFFFFN